MAMDRVGISFQSKMSPDEVRDAYIRPLRAALEDAKAGIYTNYLHQAEGDPDQPAEHLMMFQVRDFEGGLRLLRTELEKLVTPGMRFAFHNLNPSTPAY